MIMVINYNSKNTIMADPGKHKKKTIMADPGKHDTNFEGKEKEVFLGTEA